MTDLGLELVRTTGRASRPMQTELVRELSPTDLALLALERGIKPPTVVKLKDSHHAVARCIAEGKKDVETQFITGLSANRISILKNDPAFMELIEFYKAKVAEIKDAAFINAQAKLAAIGSDALDELSDRLTETPDKVTNDELIDIVKLTADRTGNGPQSKSTNVNLNIDLAARVASGRQRVQRLLSAPSAADASVVVEGEVVASHSTASPSLVPEEKK